MKKVGGRGPKTSGNGSKKSKSYSFIAVSFSILLIKVLWLSSQQGKGILGADGENYLEALEGLLNEGFFSREDKLSYWPAGYPILLWPLAKVTISNLLFLTGILQSVLFAFVVAFFAAEMNRGQLKKFAWPSMFLLSLNPTLSLNSTAIGYEVNVACLFLLSITMFMRMLRFKSNSVINVESIAATLSLALAAFMQPRTMLIALGVLVPFAIFHFKGKRVAIFLIFATLLISIAPTILIIRNQNANGFAVISTNLGVTMNIGAGPNATGGYSNNAKGVPCATVTGNAAAQDKNTVFCVMNWYLQNPSKGIKLFANKAVFHWSPWFGPLANGTMARNPWVSFHPASGMLKEQNGQNIVYGWVGSFISWIWLLASVVLLVIGFVVLRRRGGASTWLAWTLFIPVVLNTVSSMATIGDHRFRIPTMTMSLLLQMFGIYAMFSFKSFRWEIEGKVKLNYGVTGVNPLSKQVSANH